MSCHQAVDQWTEEVTRHMPHLSKPQAAVLSVMERGHGVSPVVCADRGESLRSQGTGAPAQHRAPTGAGVGL